MNQCDLVARNDSGQFIVVEMKKSLNLTLLIQGVKRMSLTDQVYLAVEYTPRSRKKHAFTWQDAVRLCKRIGIGLITVQFYQKRKPRIEVLCDPGASSARRAAHKRKRMEREFLERSGDYQLGGITGEKLVTAYREKSLHCAYALKEGTPMRLKDIRESTGDNGVSNILQKNYYGWFAREQRGVYRLTEQGKAALKQYADIVEHMLDQQSSGDSSSRSI